MTNEPFGSVGALQDVIFNSYFLIGGLFLSYLVYRIIHSILDDNNYMQTKHRLNGHTWRSIQCNKSVPYNSCCTVCGKLMLPIVGLFCECCAVSACKRCHRVLDKKMRCKQVTWPSDHPFLHQWVNVGVSRGENGDSNEEGEVLKKFYCSWCQRIKICSENISNNTDAEQCDFLKYHKIIIPPMCVQLEKGKVSNIKPLTDEDWEPLVIFANRKSGSNRTDEVLSLFRGLLNPIQVIDISVTPPEAVVQWLPPRCRIIVAGGDGTVAWVLNALYPVTNVRAAVGILPMGTGNDLSRSLGWGAGTGQLDAHSIINSIVQAEEQPLDRWKVTITPRRGRLGRVRAARILHAYNYASVGVDAQVALDFHRARSQFLYRYASRWLNYAAYAVLGAGRALDAGAGGGLERRLSVRTRRGALPLPPLQALVLLSIPCWGAGVCLWSMGSEDDVPEQSMSDGKFEVVGISSSFHIARLQCGLAEPFRFTQTSKVEIVLNGRCAMQVDGEPWMQGAATITMEPAGQSLVLRASPVHHD